MFARSVLDPKRTIVTCVSQWSFLPHFFGSLLSHMTVLSIDVSQLRAIVYQGRRSTLGQGARAPQIHLLLPLDSTRTPLGELTALLQNP